MIGYIEKKNLNCADEERRLDPRRLRRQTAIQKTPDQMAQRAEPAQYRRGQGADQRAVALGERGELVCRIEKFVEGAAAAQDAIENIGSEPAHGEARRFAG